jgi:hypothetical protein
MEAATTLAAVMEPFIERAGVVSGARKMSFLKLKKSRKAFCEEKDFGLWIPSSYPKA